MRVNTLLIMASFFFVAACTTSGSGPKQTGAQTGAHTRPQGQAIPKPPPQSGYPAPGTSASKFRAPTVQSIPGISGVIGAKESELIRQLGQPRLKVQEGDVRKLQFSATACVLDIYLYPMRPGGEPQATYVDARRSSDALDVDRAACIMAIRGAGR